MFRAVWNDQRLVCASLAQNNVFNLTTDIREMLDGLPRNRYVLQTLIGPPNFAGNDTNRKSIVLPSARQMVAFNTLARPLVL
ncbi:hypothetical protein TNIN_390791 [Trichonephila inaurata madagascariensis]|uniref:Uncharacterized protein n=1 Tax=Trichonephila inaurata madagascariensis TaxID=2747483 RepID=A0A8X6JS50_9ARAC|nr:hypothetical protein TNIN_390791 [Trichonephila inaurata madagascariensis]